MKKALTKGLLVIACVICLSAQAHAQVYSYTDV